MVIIKHGKEYLMFDEVLRLTTALPARLSTGGSGLRELKPSFSPVSALSWPDFVMNPSLEFRAWSKTAAKNGEPHKLVMFWITSRCEEC